MRREGEFPGQPTIYELQRLAERSKGKAKKALQPVIIEGRKIAHSWWGQAWCTNLEIYADYSNRIGRGRRYVRAGTVIDLDVEGGTIKARVQGSRKTPYKVDVSIDPLHQDRYQSLLKTLEGRIDNLEALASGSFPASMKSLFQDPKGGLFPNPREIHFSCSCPDWASMCKHVAAVLYGIGNRLDQDPLLFFAMRGIDMRELIKRSVEEKVSSMLQNANARSKRIISMKKAEGLFGVFES